MPSVRKPYEPQTGDHWAALNRHNPHAFPCRDVAREMLKLRLRRWLLLRALARSLQPLPEDCPYASQYPFDSTHLCARRKNP